MVYDARCVQGGEQLFKAALGYSVGVEDLGRSWIGVVRRLRVQGWVQVQALPVGAGVLVGVVSAGI